MSFTQDELQAFNTILEQKLTIQRREMERVFEQRTLGLRRDLEQRLLLMQQDLLHDLPTRLTEQQRKTRDSFSQQLDTQHTRWLEALQRHLAEWGQQHQQQVEDVMENALAAQLLAIEQLISQRLVLPSDESAQFYQLEPQPTTERLEMQTEITFDDLLRLINKSIDERFSSLFSSLQTLLKDAERSVALHLQQLRTDLMLEQVHPSAEQITNVHDIFTSIEQLERIIESMQVAMTANHALLSNRLHHHQQLPLERAHPASQPTPTPVPLSQPEEVNSEQ